MFVFVVLGLATAAAVQGKCDKGCAVPVAPYEEMGCEPVFAKREDCCPAHYNCAKFEGRAADKCYVKGKVYNRGESIDDDATLPNCLAACYCSKNEWQDITCGYYDCIVHKPLEPGCYFGHHLGSCCKSKSICPPFDKIPKCEVDGKTYYEGQQWYSISNDQKLRCVCKEGFKGKLEAPFCAEDSCGIEITNSQDFRRKCAPVFYGPNRCPHQWKCFKDGDVVVPNQTGTTSKQKCKFGEKQLNIGDKLVLNLFASSPKIDCECKIPPLLTCIQKPDETPRKYAISGS